MSSLGGAFPEDMKRQYIHDALTPGAVIRIHTDLTTPPKIKRFVVIRISSDKSCLAGVFINTDINFNVQSTQELAALQYLLYQDDHDGTIDRDCYVDCSEFHEMGTESVIPQLVDSPESMLGHIPQSHLSDIVKLIRSSPLMSKKKLRKFGLA